VIRVRLGERVFTPPEISAFILRELKSWATNIFRMCGPRGHYRPAYFNDASARPRATPEGSQDSKFCAW